MNGKVTEKVGTNGMPIRLLPAKSEAGTWFHTSGDTPEQATTSAALGIARDAVWNATQALLG